MAASQNEMNIAISNSRRLERKSLLWFVLQVGKGNCFLFKLYEFNIMYARLIFILSRRSIDYIRNLSKIKLLSLLHIFFFRFFFIFPDRSECLVLIIMTSLLRNPIDLVGFHIRTSFFPILLIYIVNITCSN